MHIVALSANVRRLSLLFRSGYFGNGVKISPQSAARAFHLPLHRHTKPAQLQKIDLFAEIACKVYLALA